MSYSFTITAATKTEAGEKVDAELAKVVESQPIHAHDRQAAQDNAEAVIDLLPDHAEEEEIYVSVAGSVSWRGDETITGCSVNAYASIVAKQTA